MAPDWKFGSMPEKMKLFFVSPFAVSHLMSCDDRYSSDFPIPGFLCVADVPAASCMNHQATSSRLGPERASERAQGEAQQAISRMSHPFRRIARQRNRSRSRQRCQHSNTKNDSVKKKEMTEGGMAEMCRRYLVALF